MILAFIILLCAIGIVSVVIFLVLKKSSSCLGKSCSSSSDCCSSSPDCINGKCCSTDCKGKNCSENNSCGQSCTPAVCGSFQECLNGNCCTPNCDPNTCGDNGCGGSCECDEGYNCIVSDDGVKSCCKAPDCSSGFCGDTNCGSCKCVDVYCANGCCQNSSCVYEDICNSNPNFTGILKNSWARFCNSCTSANDHCKLISPQFFPGSFVPKSGTIQCTSCTGKSIPDVNIDGVASYYEYDANKNTIDPVYNSGYCKDSSGKCNSTCVCITDGDCKAYGCNSCLGGYCV
jgi:hypothetical protein